MKKKRGRWKTGLCSETHRLDLDGPLVAIDLDLGVDQHLRGVLCGAQASAVSSRRHACGKAIPAAEKKKTEQRVCERREPKTAQRPVPAGEMARWGGRTGHGGDGEQSEHGEAEHHGYG